jgi:hypothetical protein
MIKQSLLKPLPLQSPIWVSYQRTPESNSKSDITSKSDTTSKSNPGPETRHPASNSSRAVPIKYKTNSKQHRHDSNRFRIQLQNTQTQLQQTQLQLRQTHVGDYVLDVTTVTNTDPAADAVVDGALVNEGYLKLSMHEWLSTSLDDQTEQPTARTLNN